MTLAGIIFDLDGTIGETLPHCVKAYQHVFRTFLQREFTTAEVMQLFGPTEEGILSRQLADRYQEGMFAYLKYYEHYHSDCPEPFPGIKEALDLLKSHGLSIGLVTGKGYQTTLLSLKYFGLVDYFQSIETGSLTGGIKTAAIQKTLQAWKIAPQRVAYLGDAASDMDAAARAEVIGLRAQWARTAQIEDHTKSTAVPAATFFQVTQFIDWLQMHIPHH
jgi:phosphoglycolate phosphatase-like HAD superfamily hydrolase